MLKPGRDCWKIAQAQRAALIVDAADYFEHARNAMLQAQSQIFLIGWDFDTRIDLARRGASDNAPTVLGPLLSHLATTRPDLKIYVIAWDQGLISVPGRGTTALRLLKWKWDGVAIKWDSTHPLNASHHQKILAIDDSLAFCGGIDITAERWDTREHGDDEPGRKRPFTGRSYEPWHDATMAVSGEAARVIGDLARLRWKICVGEELPPATHTGNRWPRKLKTQFENVPLAVSRTRAPVGNYDEVREIEALFVNMIRAARRRIYIETQYFASRVVAEALAKRLSKRDAPEVVIINPRTGEGWLDDSVMSAARYHLFEALRQADRHDRFRIYYPVTEGSQDIYVHAKIMIVDDLYLRVGSANLNNRSMGLDSECDVVVDGRDDASARKAIRAIQSDLVAEHLGVTPRKIEAALETEGSLIGAIETLRGSGRTLWPLDPTRPGGLKSAVSLSEALDPEASESFEPKARAGLLRHFRQFGGHGVSHPSAEAQVQAPASARRAKARSGANSRRPRD